MRNLLMAAALGLCVAASAAAAQTTPDPSTCITRPQARQLVDGIEARNAQIGALNARVLELEAQLAQAQIEARAARDVTAIAEQKNRELVSIGREILSDYESRSLGERVASGEPLTQIYRVRLENALQEYAARVAEQRLFVDRELATARARASAPSPQ